MTRPRNLLFCSFILIFTGCIKQPQSPPPAPPAVSKPAPKQAGAVWVDGRYKWSGSKYVWIPGHWAAAPAGKHWVPGHWQKTARGYRWVDGHWEGAGTHPKPHKPPPKPHRR